MESHIQIFESVVDHCYLCDLCFMTKCPYVPPHDWEIDFPHLMLRVKQLSLINKNHLLEIGFLLQLIYWEI